MLVILFDDLSPPSYSSIQLDRSIVIRFDLPFFFFFPPPILFPFNQEKCRFSNARIELWTCVRAWVTFLDCGTMQFRLWKSWKDISEMNRTKDRNEESRLDKSRLLAGMKREVCGISIRGYSSRIYQFITKGRLIESGWSIILRERESANRWCVRRIGWIFYWSEWFAPSVMHWFSWNFLDKSA